MSFERYSSTDLITTPGMPANNNNAAEQLAKAINNNQGTIDMSGGVIYNVFPVPTSFTFTTVNNNAMGATAITQYIFNNGVLNAAVTNNGSATAVVNTYGDGFVGRIYEQYLRSANNGKGVLIKGFTVISQQTSTGDQTSVPFNTMNMQVLTSNGQGGLIPIPINVTEALRNTQQQVGILTPVKPFYLNSLQQISVYVPVDITFAFTFFTETSTFNG